MTMTVTNRFTSINFLNVLNRASTRLDSSLTKISSGQKINSAADNASDYSISERMREQLRSLNQTDQNVQNGLSMVKVAEGGIQRIVDILRDMKSLAINAANDSNTNADREIIQREMMKRLATINDIAIGTKYNNKGLIDGTFEPGTVLEEQVVNVRKFNLQSINMTSTKDYTKEVSPDGSRIVIAENKIKNLAHSFTQTDDTTTKIDSGSDLRAAYMQPPMNADFGFKDSSWNWTANYRANWTENNETYTLLSVRTSRYTNNKEIGVEIDFSSAEGANGSVADDFDGQGFSILCSGCSQYINIVFDKSMNIGQGTLTTFTDNTLRKDFRVGIGDATSTDDLARAIFEGIKNSGRKPYDRDHDIYKKDSSGNIIELLSVEIDADRHNFRIAKNPNADGKYLFIKEKSTRMLILDSGTIMATGGPGSKDDLPDPVSTEIIDGKEVQKINVDTAMVGHIWDKEEAVLETIIVGYGAPLTIHDGTQRGDYNLYTIKNMQTSALGIGNILDDDGDFVNARDRAKYNALSAHPDKQREFLENMQEAARLAGNEISVKTAEDAKVAIKILDEALNYALDNATKIGSYLQRMESMENTIYTVEENTEASKSVIRDTDISKEIVAYTRSNVLSQSVQFMLAQSNNNSFMVLNLLR
ncbi:MAG: flagellin [Selenomonadaceae bacterium]|nr:flagellin [Selenomonadaceae bacterium]